MAYLGVGLNFWYNFWFKNAPESQNGGHFENFDVDDVTDDVKASKCAFYIHV